MVRLVEPVWHDGVAERVGRQSGFSAVGKNRDLRTAASARLALESAYV